MAVKLKHAGPGVSWRTDKHRSEGGKQAGQVGSGFLGGADGGQDPAGVGTHPWVVDDAL